MLCDRSAQESHTLAMDIISLSFVGIALYIQLRDSRMVGDLQSRPLSIQLATCCCGIDAGEPRPLAFNWHLVVWTFCRRDRNHIGSLTFGYRLRLAAGSVKDCYSGCRGTRNLCKPLCRCNRSICEPRSTEFLGQWKNCAPPSQQPGSERSKPPRSKPLS
jgi:hypothetical protein